MLSVFKIEIVQFSPPTLGSGLQLAHPARLPKELIQNIRLLDNPFSWAQALALEKEEDLVGEQASHLWLGYGRWGR